jgi:hypothetical protein
MELIDDVISHENKGAKQEKYTKYLFHAAKVQKNLHMCKKKSNFAA